MAPVWDDTTRTVYRDDGTRLRGYNAAEDRAAAARANRAQAAAGLPDVKAAVEGLEAWFVEATTNPDTPVDMGAVMGAVFTLARQVDVLTEIVTGLTRDSDEGNIP